MLTGVTTLLALLALYLFGGEVIRSFTFAMIFGILVGTYSSIFVAGPLLILFKLRPAGSATKRRGASRAGGGAAVEDVTAAMAEGIVIREAHFPGRAPIEPMAMAASASPTCRIAARSCACRPASTAGSRPIRWR